MTTIISASANVKLAVHGKRAIAASMCDKGKAFLGAAVLLRQKGGSEYVVLHLLCQGIEVLLKGLLLSINYDRFKPELKKYGHNLLSVTKAATSAAGLSPLRPRLRAELEALNRLYSCHHLRYGSVCDIFIDPITIPSRLVLRRMVALLAPRQAQRRGKLE